MFMTSEHFEHILLILLCIVTTNYFNILIRDTVPKSETYTKIFLSFIIDIKY